MNSSILNFLIILDLYAILLGPGLWLGILGHIPVLLRQRQDTGIRPGQEGEIFSPFFPVVIAYDCCTYSNYACRPQKNDEGPARNERENSVIPSLDRLIPFSPSAVSSRLIAVISVVFPPVAAHLHKKITYTVSTGVMNGARDYKRPNNESFPDQPSRVVWTCNLKKSIYTISKIAPNVW